MTPAEYFNGPYKELRELSDRITRAKNKDYGDETDFGDNFKSTARRLGLTVGQVWGVYADKQWCAVLSYARRGRVESEPILNRLADVINYCHLLAGLIADGAIGGSAKEVAGGGEAERLVEEAVSGGAGKKTHGALIRTQLTPEGVYATFEDGFTTLYTEAKEKGFV